jgi:hypothetical protein
MIIDCDSCVMRQIACSDCVVSVLLDLKPAPGRKAELSNADEAAINNLSLVGLVPPLRFVPKSTNRNESRKLAK